ncbi:MAG TPA: potassium-transporting ATPase subunit KdpC [Bryobacteraceae bacterium]|nr:potassium-transporting ATPase subunit KdpC [Bryobacteraceae bacterium]
MITQLSPGFRMILLLTAITGALYPAVVTIACQTLFPFQANGSLVKIAGQVRGSELVGQDFTSERYFHPRPSAAGTTGYDAAASSGSNLGPVSRRLVDRVRATTAKLHEENPAYTRPWPSDMATASASGLDPHISPESMEAQMQRVAAARGIDTERLRHFAQRFVEERDFGLLGEPRVNVLRLNLALDSQLEKQEAR